MAEKVWVIVGFDSQRRGGTRRARGTLRNFTKSTGHYRIGPERRPGGEDGSGPQTRARILREASGPPFPQPRREPSPAPRQPTGTAPALPLATGKLQILLSITTAVTRSLHVLCLPDVTLNTLVAARALAAAGLG
ncbi:hypothetical protein E2C01_074597 [Portunus trituberculatus]|uniref:Uncharacterized protein n=1 Tax=Portunus trituberculatus TaxID=210409 RepID=A0A5B7IHN1_PORTR|nr:hypothetical protein [Portunus trituberculatus]